MASHVQRVMSYMYMIVCVCISICTCSLSRSEYHTVIIFESSTRALEIDHVVRKKTS